MSEPSAAALLLPPPTVVEELDRKAIDYLETMVHRAETNQLDHGQLGAMGRAIWSVLAGIASKGVTDLAATVAAAYRPALKRHFVGKGYVRSVIWNQAGRGYLIVTRNALGEKTGQTVRNTEIGIRESELETLFATLRKSGYLEI